MRYLVTYSKNGVQKSFYTDYFDINNHFNPNVNMVVFDFKEHKYMVNTLGWSDIEFDNL